MSEVALRLYLVSSAHLRRSLTKRKNLGKTHGRELFYDTLEENEDGQKKGRASDAVVGQVLRYMGYVKQELAEPNQSVKSVIIALDDDTRIRRALAMTPDISFYRYEVSFKLTKAN
jgi:hypothetical protein